jgi:Tol biopolymer transport system component
MNDAGWARVKELFHASVALPEAERESFLRRETPDDPALYAEVRSLLDADANDDELSAPIVFAPGESVFIGQTLNHYRVLERLGSGGMGEVFVAEDTKLGRKVALKVLPQDVVRNSDRRRRFEGEARAIAALHHPNIVTIYSVEEAPSTSPEQAGLPFITMELVQGSPLAAIIPTAGLPRERLFRLATALADAVTAAHQHGIVHRDLKPANVMVTPDDGIKVLDFGLAKLRDQSGTPAPSDTAAASQRAGDSMLWGTVSYMSPEQAQGKGADERSDVFSLGIMLYEMATGQRPFKGSSRVSILSSILNDTPPPVTAVKPALPARFSRIVARALEKDPERRFRTAAGLRDELAAISRGRRRPILAVAAAVVSLALIVGIGAVMSRRNPDAAPPFEHFRMTRLTTSGAVVRAAISRDGRHVLQVVVDGGRQSLRVQQTGAVNTVQIVPPADVLYVGLTPSPDGNDVYFVTYPKDANIASLYRVPVHGGVPVKILENIDTGVSFSPDSKRFAFVRGFTGGTAVVVANVDGTGETIIARRTLPMAYLLSAPAWHPEGQVLALSAVDERKPGRTTVLGVLVANGQERVIAEADWTGIRGLAWMPDGRGLVVTAVQPVSSPARGQIWYVPITTGGARRVTNDLTDYSALSISADSRTLVAVQTEVEAHLWTSNPDGRNAVQITSGARSADGSGGLAWTPEGRIVFVARRGEAPDVFVTDADGSNQRPLVTDGSVKSDPVVTADGKRLLFTSRRDLTSHIFSLDLRGGVVSPLTQGEGELTPIPSPDGKWVYFATRDPARYFSGILWRIPVEGGERSKVTEKGIQPLALSPDGKILAGNIWDDTAHRVRLATISLDGAETLRVFPLGPRTVAWTPDGRLTYVENVRGVGNVWQLPLDGTPPRQLTLFLTDRVIAFAWSPDGMKLAAARGKTTSDVVIITDMATNR